MIKLALTDLDDTLIPLTKRDAPASDYAMQAIRAVLDAGLHFGPVTGRTPLTMGDTFHGDPRCAATGAYANGQLILLDGEVIHREWSPAEALQHVAEVLEEEGDAVLCVYDVDASTRSFIASSEEAARAQSAWFPSMPPVSRRVEKPYLKSNIHSAAPRARLEEIQALLRREVPELDFIFPSQTAPLLDIVPAGYGKGSAVKILAEAMGIGLDEVATFGDSENDLSMLTAVPNSVAVANASEEAARAARWHIGASADEGVADALLDIARAAKTGSMPSFMQ